LVTPKARAKHEQLFIKLTSVLSFQECKLP
jgi:hypothetical protein